jgi:hypothetical protein
MSRINLTKKPKVRKTSLPKSFDTKYLGEEPEFDIIEEDEHVKLAQAYSWYNYFYTSETAKPWLVEYVKKSGNAKLLEAVKATSPNKITITTCAAARMLNRGTVLPDRTITYLRNKLIEIQAAYENSRAPRQTVVVKANVQRHINDQIDNLIADIEDQIDQFTINGYKSDFSMYDHLTKNGVKALQAKRIAEYYIPQRDEFKAVVQTKYEGYSNKKNAQAYFDFIGQIVDDCLRHSENQVKTRQVVRKPRKRKEVSAAKLVAGVKYKVSDKDLKIVSIAPTEILGAQVVWLYNTKYKYLIKVVAADKNDLGIKGTTITGYDETSSVYKTLRKPETQIKDLLSTGKVRLRTFLDDIKTVARPFNGRINKETLILKATK